MEIARTFQINCYSCHKPGLVRMTFFEKCILGKCSWCNAQLMFCRHSKYCKSCDNRTDCFLQYPIIVGDKLSHVKETTKDEKDKVRSFNWRDYTLDTSKLDCV